MTEERSPESVQATGTESEATMPKVEISAVSNSTDLSENETASLEQEVDQAELMAPVESYTHLTKTQLLDRLKDLAQQDDVADQIENIQNLKKAFNALKDEEKEASLNRFIEAGGERKDFVLESSAEDELFDELLRGFEARRQEIKRLKDKEQQESTKIRGVIIEELKQLAEVCDKGEHKGIRQVFDQLHQLQERWKNSGVPVHSEYKRLQDSYRFYNDEVYKFIKLDKEIRDLHYRKNLLHKTELCEKAEKLITEPNLKLAIDGVRALIEEWKNTGAVNKDVSDTIWERFKSAADQVFMRRKENVLEALKSQEENLTKKLALLRRMDDVNEKKYTSAAAWIKASEGVDEILKEWKNTGFATPEENEKVWELFRQSRQKFYQLKEEFFETLRKVYQDNYKIKNDLCMQVEAVKDSQDWKQTTELILSLQKKWKETGPVAYKHSEKLWQRFREGCDHFFNLKKAHFAGQEAEFEENLKSKESLLEKLNSFVPAENNQENFEKLKSIQAEWLNIGLVPMKHKDRINKSYRALLDKHFNAIRTGNQERHMSNFTQRVETMAGSSAGRHKMHDEMIAVQEKIKRKENEAALLENNIGFFARSKNADGIIQETKKKIEAIRRDVSSLRDQLKILRNMADNKQDSKKTDVRKNEENKDNNPS